MVWSKYESLHTQSERNDVISIQTRTFSYVCTSNKILLVTGELSIIALVDGAVLLYVREPVLSDGCILSIIFGFCGL
jgi:hypothetical protein